MDWLGTTCLWEIFSSILHEPDMAQPIATLLISLLLLIYTPNLPWHSAFSKIALISRLWCVLKYLSIDIVLTECFFFVYCWIDLSPPQSIIEILFYYWKVSFSWYCRRVNWNSVCDRLGMLNLELPSAFSIGATDHHFKNVLWINFPRIVFMTKFCELRYRSAGSFMDREGLITPHNIHCKRRLLDTSCRLLLIFSKFLITRTRIRQKELNTIGKNIFFFKKKSFVLF